MRQNILIFGGILGFILGMVFMLQGLGIIRGPAGSMMIDNQVWVWRGGALALVSAILVAAARLVPQRKRKDD